MPWDYGHTERDPPVWHDHPLNKYRRRKVDGPLPGWHRRYEWLAKAPEYSERLNNRAPPFLAWPPASYANHVHFTHTATEECEGLEGCAKVLQPLQEKHMAEGEPDIRHSFMISGDGLIFEGRGWDTMTNIPEDFTTFYTASLDVALIGDFSTGGMPWKFFDDGRAPQWHTHPIKRNPQPPGLPLPMVTRDQWMASRTYVRLDDEVRVWDKPVGHVRMTYTDTWRCENDAECKRLVYELQMQHMTKYSYDIMWSFLIAPDGQIYEGRGWKYFAERPQIEKYEHLKEDCVDIAYIGNYIARPVPQIMKDGMQRLIDWGVANGKIHCCYDVIPHTDPLYPLPKETDPEYQFWDHTYRPQEIHTMEEYLKHRDWGHVPKKFATWDWEPMNPVKSDET